VAAPLLHPYASRDCRRCRQRQKEVRRPAAVTAVAAFLPAAFLLPRMRFNGGAQLLRLRAR